LEKKQLEVIEKIWIKNKNNTAVREQKLVAESGD
jgi:hypothetical protein